MNKRYIYKILVLAVITVLIFPIGRVDSASLSCTNIASNLRVKSRGLDVTKLQNFLNAHGYMKIKATGYFGGVTEKAVKEFQTKEGLASSGLVLNQTRSKVSDISCKTKALVTPETPAITTPVNAPTTPVVPVVSIKKLPYTSSDFSDWRALWGKISTTTENVLEIKASETTNGAQAILSETSEWKDYKFTANVFVKQSTVTLIARYVDENNFLACTFSGKYVEILQKVNGQSKIVAYTVVHDAPYTSFFYNDINVSMRVNGNNVGCSLLGSDDNVTFSNVDSALLKGGVGLQSWVNGLGVANISLINVQISEI